MNYRATREGMMPRFWRIVNERGETVRSGLTSAVAAKEIAATLTARSRMCPVCCDGECEVKSRECGK